MKKLIILFVFIWITLFMLFACTPDGGDNASTSAPVETSSTDIGDLPVYTVETAESDGLTESERESIKADIASRLNEMLIGDDEPES